MEKSHSRHLPREIVWQQNGAKENDWTRKRTSDLRVPGECSTNWAIRPYPLLIHMTHILLGHNSKQVKTLVAVPESNTIISSTSGSPSTYNYMLTSLFIKPRTVFFLLQNTLITRPERLGTASAIINYSASLLKNSRKTSWMFSAAYRIE